MSNLIEAKNIHLYRYGQHILDDVSLSIGEQDFVTIIGPNGAGKSMLLKTLMRFHKPDSGTVLARPNLRIGYVPQRLVADATMPITVRRFLTLQKKTNDEELLQVAQETNIENILDQLLATLSGGELQRVLLTRALLGKPQLLILDEPTQSLDVGNELNFYNLLQRAYDKYQLSILMVSHDLHMVMASTKKVICLFHHICCSGAPQAVTQDPKFLALFGEDMAKMMKTYQHYHYDHCDHNS